MRVECSLRATGTAIVATTGTIIGGIETAVIATTTAITREEPRIAKASAPVVDLNLFWGPPPAQGPNKYLVCDLRRNRPALYYFLHGLHKRIKVSRLDHVVTRPVF